ncbi:hypothetical protein ACS0TY_030161 [Phlomoides rotata]
MEARLGQASQPGCGRGGNSRITVFPPYFHRLQGSRNNWHGKSCRDSQNHHQKQNNRPIFHLLIFLPIPRLQLKHLILSSVTEACNNSVFLLGPRGCGKKPVLELVLEDLLKEYPDMIYVIKLNGLVHNDNNCALKGEAGAAAARSPLKISQKQSSVIENVLPKLICAKLDEAYDLQSLICESIACPQQLNGFDCGMFTVKYIKFLLAGKDVSLIRPNYMREWRKKLAADIFFTIF